MKNEGAVFRNLGALPPYGLFRQLGHLAGNGPSPSFIHDLPERRTLLRGMRRFQEMLLVQLGVP